MKRLAPIKKTRTYEMIVDQLRYSIEKGWYKPGEKLPSERELAQQLAISRNAVREALSILQTSNIIEVKPGIGAFLVEDNIENILEKIMNIIVGNEQINLIELLEVRQGIEATAIYLATQNRNLEHIKHIENALIALENEVSNNKLGAKEDLNFHMAIGRASENKMIIDILNLISDQILEALKETRYRLVQEDKVQEFITDHRNIYETIVSGEALKARDLMWNKLQRTIDFHYSIKNE